MNVKLIERFYAKADSEDIDLLAVLERLPTKDPEAFEMLVYLIRDTITTWSKVNKLRLKFSFMRRRRTVQELLERYYAIHERLKPWDAAVIEPLEHIIRTGNL